MIKFIAWFIIIYFGYKLLKNLLRLISGDVAHNQNAHTRSKAYTYTYSYDSNTYRQAHHATNEGEIIIEKLDSEPRTKKRTTGNDIGEYVSFEEIK